MPILVQRTLTTMLSDMCLGLVGDMEIYVARTDGPQESLRG